MGRSGRGRDITQPEAGRRIMNARSAQMRAGKCGRKLEKWALRERGKQAGRQTGEYEFQGEQPLLWNASKRIVWVSDGSLNWGLPSRDSGIPSTECKRELCT